MWTSRAELIGIREQLEAIAKEQHEIHRLLEQVIARLGNVARHFEIGGSNWLPPMPDDEPTKPGK